MSEPVPHDDPDSRHVNRHTAARSRQRRVRAKRNAAKEAGEEVPMTPLQITKQQRNLLNHKEHEEISAKARSPEAQALKKEAARIRELKCVLKMHNELVHDDHKQARQLIDKRHQVDSEEKAELLLGLKLALTQDEEALSAHRNCVFMDLPHCQYSYDFSDYYHGFALTFIKLFVKKHNLFSA